MNIENINIYIIEDAEYMNIHIPIFAHCVAHKRFRRLLYQIRTGPAVGINSTLW